MRVLITGANGMLGRDLVAALAGHEVTALGRGQLDITDADAVARAARGFGSFDGFDAIVNAAAYTAVDAAEIDEDAAYAVNATGPANLAAAAAATGAKLVTISTDYVFDGTATSPYAEDHPRHPISAYGRTKAAGEKLALAAHPAGTYVVRTAWLYGQHGPNFAATMLKLAASKDAWDVVDDQRGQPTWTGDLAVRIAELLGSDAPAGIYHGTASGETSWFGFARAVLEEAGLDPERIRPTDSTAFVRPAPRPAYSVLGHARWADAGLAPMRHWREALAASGIARTA
ncbi:dTDP-4-dehydrorhamnose reductase [Agromyces archimandritae]|uniref:dTDP-4-dehydrorhamnose reductase n=1 Tax=Agromyces archimandritae TaxID=2781962 RepID=A0A975IP51_9MICO|nr:dTDP-4-dehydrorhamnose reductase [Agromyces archimandritae]QTX05288.1 dTDP-4-dehydrorhamnose reductase [Agromyces archimandritae]